MKVRIGADHALIFLGVVFYLFLFPHGIHGDAAIRYQALLKLLTEGRLEPMLYSYVGPLLSSPLYLLGFIVKDSFWWLSRFNTFVFLFTAWALWRHFQGEWDTKRNRAFVLLFFCGSMFPKHVTDYYSEVLTSCLAALAIVLYSRRKFWPASALLCLSAWNTPGTAPAALLLGLYFALKEMRLRYAIVALLIIAGVLGENWLKFGSFSSPYLGEGGPKTILPYSGMPGFSYPLFFGLLSIFFSFGKGLAFFCPGLLGIFSRDLFRSPLARFLVPGFFYLAGLLLVYGRWWAWAGDLFWGPRYLFFATILSVVALAALWPDAASASRRIFFWVIGAGLSIWVGCQGIMWGQDFLELCHTANTAHICLYVPELSVLWRPFVVWPEIRGRKVAYLAYFFLVFVYLLREPITILAKRAWKYSANELKRLLTIRDWKF